MEERGQDTLQTQQERPTTLRLIQNSDPNLTAFFSQLEVTRFYQKSISDISLSVDKLFAEYTARINRMIEDSNEVHNDLRRISSSRVCSLAYLVIWDELSAKGVSHEQIFDFYQECLSLNILLCEDVVSQFDKLGASRTRALSGARDFRKTAWREIYEKNLPPIPDWFKGDGNDWLVYIWVHGNFAVLLNPKIFTHLRDAVADDRIFEQSSITFKDALPDWLSGSEPGKIPQRQEVEDELIQLAKDKEIIIEETEQSKREMNYLFSLADTKIPRARARQETLRRELWSSIKGFADMILFIELNRPWEVYDCDPEEIRSMNTQQLIQRALPEEKVIQGIIEAFVNGEIIPKEVVSLWLEKALKEAKVIKDSQEPFSETDAEKAKLLLQMFEDNSDLDVVEKKLRDLDKTTLYAARFGLKWFFDLISNDGILYLMELVDECRENPSELFIWEVSDIFITSLKEHDLTADDTFTEKIATVKKFASGWIKRNWGWVYDELADYTHEIAANLNNPQDATSNLDDKREADTEDVLELETSIKEIQKGNLDGWQFFYTYNGRIDSASVTKIQGETILDVSEFLHYFIGRESIPCTVEAKDIISAFDKIVVEPPERTRKRKVVEIDGILFKVAKKGQNMRILHLIDHESKNIVFLLHKKSGWEYKI